MKEPFTAMFLRKMTEAISRSQRTGSYTHLDVYKRQGQEGLLYEAHDYAVHGQLADHVIIMTYEWGYLYNHA